MDIGLSVAQLRYFVSTLDSKVGKDEAARAARLLDVVLKIEKLQK